jgi:hypothetical protein
MHLVEYWLLNPNGTVRCPLPQMESWTLSPVRNDAGSLQFTYPEHGVNWAALHETVTLDRDCTIQVRIDGVIQPQLQAIIKQTQGDDVAEGRVWTYTGCLANGRLLEAVVEPKSGMPAQGNDSTIEQDGHYYSCTMGTIASTLLLEAQLRGALPGVTFGSFNSAHDSNNVPWSQIITLKLTPGVDYLKVFQALVEAGLGDFQLEGFDVRLYEPDTLGVDRTLTNPPLIFREGGHLLDSPRQHKAPAGSAALIVGANGVYDWVEDPDTTTRLGRRIETSSSQGSISDPGTLTAYGQHWLGNVTHGRMEINHGLAPTEAVPIIDFNLHDWAWSKFVNRPHERLRIAQWTWASGTDGTQSIGVTLNDLIAEGEQALAKRLQGIAGGTTITGTSNARQIPDEYIDGVAPNPPAGLDIDSVAYITDEGTTLSAVTVTWDAVLLNANGTAMTDLGRYSVWWRYTDPAMYPGNPLLAWTSAGDTGQLFASFSGVRPGVWIDVRVGAIDVAGNFSGWSATAQHLTANDTDAPPTPAHAVLTPWIGTISADVSGLGALGETMPADLLHIEVHTSTVDNFPPTTATLYDTVIGAATVAITNAAYGVTLYVRLVAVDTSGNRSDPSAVTSAAPRQILNPDVANLSIGNAQIIGLDVAKVTAGTISSPWIIGNTVQTAETGARFGFNASEFFAYRADGTKTVQITNAGAASFLGEIRTNTANARIVMNPGGTAPAEMRFYPANNSLGKYISLFTSDIPGQAPGYSLVYLKGDRYAGLPGEAAIRMWYYEASFGWFDATADILSAEESAFYARMYSCGINSSTILHTAHGLRSAAYHEFAFQLTGTTTTGMGRMRRDADNAFMIGCPAKGSAFAFQVGWIYAVAEGDSFDHIGFTAQTVTQSSGRAKKTNIGAIDSDVLAVLDAAPAHRWEYQQDHRQRPQPQPVRRRKPRQDGEDQDPKDELIAVELEPNPRPMHRRWGPMAEDLPDGVVITDPRDGGLLIDHGSMLGLQWEILRQLHRMTRDHGQAVEKLTGRIAAVERRPTP